MIKICPCPVSFPPSPWCIQVEICGTLQHPVPHTFYELASVTKKKRPALAAGKTLANFAQIFGAFPKHSDIVTSSWWKMWIVWLYQKSLNWWKIATTRMAKCYLDVPVSKWLVTILYLSFIWIKYTFSIYIYIFNIYIYTHRVHMGDSPLRTGM